MTTRFIRDPEIAASLAPFRAMRRDAATLYAKMRDEMGELMAQGAIDLGVSVLAEPRVQRNESLLE